MGCDSMIYEAKYSNNGDINLIYLGTIRGYDFLDNLPLEIASNNGFFEISGEILMDTIKNTFVEDDDLKENFTFAIYPSKDYMISISY